MSAKCPRSVPVPGRFALGIALVLLALGSAGPGYSQQIGQLELPKPDTSRDTVKRLIAARHYPQAEIELDRLLRTNPADHELTVLQALNFFYEHKYPKSRYIVTRLIATQSATAEVRVLSGLLYIVGNELGSAEAEFRMAVELDGKNAAAHYYLGRALYMRQAIDPSIVEFQQSIALDANFIQAYDALGLAWFVKEDSRQAQLWFLRGMQQEQLLGGPKMEWLRLDLATMLLTHHRAAEAATYLAEAEQINPKNPQVYLELGQMYFQGSRYAEALVAYEQVLKLEPSNALAHYFRGRSYHLLKQNELAKEEFALFVSLNRQHTMDTTTSPIAERQSTTN